MVIVCPRKLGLAEAGNARNTKSVNDNDDTGEGLLLAA